MKNIGKLMTKLNNFISGAFWCCHVWCWGKRDLEAKTFYMFFFACREVKKNLDSGGGVLPPESHNVQHTWKLVMLFIIALYNFFFCCCCSIRLMFIHFHVSYIYVPFFSFNSLGRVPVFIFFLLPSNILTFIFQKEPFNFVQNLYQ